MSNDLEKRIELIEQRLSIHQNHLIRAFQKLEILALEANLMDIATEAAQEIVSLRSLIQPTKR